MVELFLAMGLIATGSLLGGLFDSDDTQAADTSDTPPDPEAPDLQLSGGPQDDLLLGGSGDDSMVGEGADALVQMDGQTYARVTGAAATLTPAMVSVVVTPIVLAA